MTLFELQFDRSPEAALAGEADSRVVRAFRELEGEIDLALVTAGRSDPDVVRFLLSTDGALPEPLELGVDEQEGFYRRGEATEDTMLQFHADFRRGVTPR
jgi:hypothetical protein